MPQIIPTKIMDVLVLIRFFSDPNAYVNLFAIIGAALKKGDAVSISGFGSFKLVQRKARKGRNPRTGQGIQIPASKAVKFTASKALKENL